MKNLSRANTKDIPPLHFLFILLLGFTILDFAVSLSLYNSTLKMILNSYWASALVLFFILGCLAIVWQFIFSSFSKRHILPARNASIVISPVLFLFLRRYQEDLRTYVLLMAIILLTQLCFFVILSRPNLLNKIKPSQQKALLIAAIILYVISINYINIQRYHNFTVFNPKDSAIYNQTFWNTINGRPFQNSTYGSNFACHNSVFFFLLLPFYYVFPHPLTLAALKVLLLALSAIPFFLIAKDILRDASALPLTLAYLLYPLLISQNFIAYHEICYAPFFLLFAYYFFRLKRFYPFILFMVVALTIKENISLLAIMFGLYALFSKRELRWIAGPIIAGVCWGIFSIAIILHFQKVYQPHPDATWFAEFIKHRFFGQKEYIHSALRQLNISNPSSLKSVFLFLAPLGIIPPLLSTISLLGLPELTVNLISDRPSMLMLPWHYNIIISCFLILATIEGIKKISNSKLTARLGFDSAVARMLLAIIVLSSTLIHSQLWLYLTNRPKDILYVETVKTVISLIPQDAFATTPKDLVTHVSSREKYSYIGEERYGSINGQIAAGGFGDYILTDKVNSPMRKLKYFVDNYEEILNRNGIVLLKKRI